jgi:hypothetical protein
MHTCTVCQQDVPPARAEFLLDTGRPMSCIKCSDRVEPHRECFMVYGHKTGGELISVSGDEAIRQARRANARAR